MADLVATEAVDSEVAGLVVPGHAAVLLGEYRHRPCRPATSTTTTRHDFLRWPNRAQT